MIGLAERPDLREECILNQTGMVLNYAKYAPVSHPPSPRPFPEDAGRLVIPPHPPEFLYCTQRRAHRLADRVEGGNNAAVHAADPDILEAFWVSHFIKVPEILLKQTFFWECYWKSEGQDNTQKVGRHWEEQLKQ